MIPSQGVSESAINPIDPNASVFGQTQQAPDWLQSQLSGKLLNQNQGGFYDQSLQTRDLYSGLLPHIRPAQQQYGDAFYNPYFVQNAGEFGAQTGKGYDPFHTNLTDYHIQGNAGDIYRDQVNPFTGEIMNSSKFASYYDLVNPSAHMFKGGISGIGNDLTRENFNKYLGGHLNGLRQDGWQFNDYAQKYYNANKGIADRVPSYSFNYLNNPQERFGY